MTTSPVVTITDELVAELERELAWSDKRSAKILAALLAERAELKRDAEMLDWLTAQGKIEDAAQGDVRVHIAAAMQAAQ